MNFDKAIDPSILSINNDKDDNNQYQPEAEVSEGKTFLDKVVDKIIKNSEEREYGKNVYEQDDSWDGFGDNSRFDVLEDMARQDAIDRDLADGVYDGDCL